MISKTDIYSVPPSVQQLDSERKLRVQQLFACITGLIGSIIITGLAVTQQMSEWLVALSLAIAFICLWKITPLIKQTVRKEDVGGETLDAILCPEIPHVVAYGKAVKQQGRMLTLEEAKTLLAICTADPEAFMKVAASFDKHDQAHPYFYSG